LIDWDCFGSDAWIERFRFLNAQRMRQRRSHSTEEDDGMIDQELAHSTALHDGSNTFQRSHNKVDMEVDS